MKEGLNFQCRVGAIILHIKIFIYSVDAKMYGSKNISRDKKGKWELMESCRARANRVKTQDQGLHWPCKCGFGNVRKRSMNVRFRGQHSSWPYGFGSVALNTKEFIEKKEKPEYLFNEDEALYFKKVPLLTYNFKEKMQYQI